MKKLALVLLAFAFPFLSLGCATFQVSDNFTTKMVVQQSTLRVLHEDPAKAARVLEILAEVRPYVEDASITLAVLEYKVNEQIRWEKLSIADAQLLQMVLSELWSDLWARYQVGLITPEARTSVYLVMDWIGQSAALVVRARG